MKQTVKKYFGLLVGLILCMAMLISGCSGSASGSSSGSAAASNASASQASASNTSGGSIPTGDYYLDLTDLGMKLTIFLRINEDGSFKFSNTTAFEVSKSEGTISSTSDGYMMVYTSVNGEAKSLSDGLTSTFTVTEDGKLDFTSCEKVYYGSATATTTSADNPDAKLIGVLITADYQAPSTESDFQLGSYTAETQGYQCRITFYEDNSYMLTVIKDGAFTVTEGGRYGVNADQLALTPENGNRAAGSIDSATQIEATALLNESDAERTSLTWNKTEDTPEVIYSFTGEGKKTGTTDTFAAELKLFADGHFEVTADGHSEAGLFVLSLSGANLKIYPDHPENGTRGLYQVTTVPAATMSIADGKMSLEGVRVRLTDSLNRDKCNFTQQ